LNRYKIGAIEFAIIRACQQLAKLDQGVLKSSTVKWTGWMIFLFNASMFLTEKPPLEEETQYKMRKRT